jgi:uncharacterized repeat protein (TIGR04076 family)
MEIGGKPMSFRDAAWQKIKWKYMKRRLGYSDEEMKRFKDDPKNEGRLERAPELLKKMIIAEVVNSHGCNSQHKEGDRFIFDGAGNLLTEKSPEKICIFALNAITPQIFAANELVHAGVNPNEMRFNRASCFDVGLACGGWGQIVMDISVEDRE